MVFKIQTVPQPAPRPISTYNAPPVLPPKPIEQNYVPIRSQPVSATRHDEGTYAPRPPVVAEVSIMCNHLLLPSSYLSSLIELCVSSKCLNSL